jgi:hypothetical protein
VVILSTIIPYKYNTIGKRCIQHMEECGWIGDTDRRKHCIYLIYDGIHYNTPRMNGELTQSTTNAIDEDHSEEEGAHDLPEGAHDLPSGDSDHQHITN